MTRSSVLGKRPHRPPVESASCDVTQNLPTPTPRQIQSASEHPQLPPTYRRQSFPHSRHFIRRHASTSNVQLSATSPSQPLFHASLRAPPHPCPARALLRPTCNNAIDIAGRAVERQAVADFIASFLNLTKPSSDEPSCLYISGSPGTGKTALVNAVIRALDNDLQTNKVKVMLVNCMALNSVDAVWVRLLEELDIPQKGKTTRKGRKGKEAPSQTVERLIAGRKFKCIIMLDELDHVASSSPALSSLFTLAETYSSHLRLIGIANTHI
ncbi:Cell division control protein 6 [Grifola frondosa]|uniref:Cell division control protein 6 n=1 Tax=Grifola frondosa TaxID=5627 RepID=A0A1C7LVS4_GRIFR|nr:Cell division control protein 6 [Grifola frondosa]